MATGTPASEAGPLHPHDTRAPEGDSVTLPLRWASADSLTTLYANHLIVSHAGDGEFYLTFGEPPPLLVADFREAANRGLLPKEVTIKPVARLALSPKTMESVVRALTVNLANFKATEKQTT